ncbi:MAG: sulfotransferase, partial [Catalinimonas sp.]
MSSSVPKPNFLIVGSGKCGTSTLAALLKEHPDCCFGREKEIHYFSVEKNLARGEAWYLDFFSHYRGESVIGEASPTYTVRPNLESAKHIHAFNPDMKIIYITRHPYQKLLSEWKMDYVANRFKARGGFETYVRHRVEIHQVLYHCCFDYQIDPYRNLFPQENILVLFLEDWGKSPEDEARKLCAFLA